MLQPYATLDDLAALWRPLSNEEQERARAILPAVSDLIRQAAHNVGKDFDELLLCNPALRTTAKLVTVDVTARYLRQSTDGEPMSQESQTALGYNWQGTYAIPGGGLANALMNNDLKRLGLKRQRIGVIDFCENPRRYDPIAEPYADRR